MRAAAAAVLLSAAVSTPATASSEARADSTTPRVVLGGDAFYPPFGMLDAKGRPTGFDVELFRAAIAPSGIEPEVRLGYWKQVMSDFAAGKVDVVPMLINGERASKYRFSMPFLDGHHLAFGRRGSPFVNSIADLVGHRVAVQDETVAMSELEGISGVDLIVLPTEGGALRKVEQGDADYAVVSVLVGYESQKRLGRTKLVVLSPPLIRRQYAFAVARGREKLLTRINSGLQRAFTTGEHDRLRQKWLTAAMSDKEAYRSGMMRGTLAAIPVLALAALLLVWWRKARRISKLEKESRAQAEARIDYLAFCDAPTGLLNINGLERSVAAHIDAATPFALVRLEFSGLAAVEAISGREFIGALTQQLVDRLSEACAGAPIARVGPAAFVVIDVGGASNGGAEHCTRPLLDTAKHPAEVDRVPVHLECHAGVAFFPEHGGQFGSLLSAANLACAAAQDRAKPWAIYDPALAPDPRNLTLLADLRSAIRRGELGFALQPKIDLPTRALVGAELLVRWKHPAYGALAPSEFVPLAEKTDVIGDMTLYLIGKALALCSDWMSRGLSITLAVNVSVNDLCSARVVDGIVGLCTSACEHITLEVTETAVMRDPGAALAAIRRLRACGIRISLDDFGTGSASLTYLKQMAPDEVKIDRSFVSGLLDSETDRSIVRSTIELAHSVGALATAEGVEDESTLEWLSAAGCDSAQGYFIGKPMPVEDFVTLLTLADEPAHGRPA